MDLNQKYSINSEKVSWRIIDGEVIILNLDSGSYYDLNATAAKIWDAITKKKNFQEMLEMLKHDYSVEEKRLKNDLKKILEELEKEKLIVK